MRGDAATVPVPGLGLGEMDIADVMEVGSWISAEVAPRTRCNYSTVTLVYTNDAERIRNDR